MQGELTVKEPGESVGDGVVSCHCPCLQMQLGSRSFKGPVSSHNDQWTIFRRRRLLMDNHFCINLQPWPELTMCQVGSNNAEGCLVILEWSPNEWVTTFDEGSQICQIVDAKFSSHSRHGIDGIRHLLYGCLHQRIHPDIFLYVRKQAHVVM